MSGAVRKPSAGKGGASDGAALEAIGLSRWYGTVLGCNDVSFRVPRGITGLLGPNGAGKSTLLRLLTGLAAPSRGEARMLGEPVLGNQALMGRLGYCPEHDGLHEDLTALEWVAAMTGLHGFAPDEARRRAEAALATVDLTSARDRRLGEYSKGMRQRAKLAQALAHDPEVLLLDEPLTGCDPKARAQILDTIRDFGQRGGTVLLSSHVLHEIEAVTSRVLVLVRGAIVADGDVHALRALMDRHPHRLRVRCDRPRALAAALADGPEVAGITFDVDDDKAITIDSRDPDASYTRIARAARETGVKLAALVSLDDNLQAVFRYLTEKGGQR